MGELVTGGFRMRGRRLSNQCVRGCLFLSAVVTIMCYTLYVTALNGADFDLRNEGRLSSIPLSFTQAGYIVVEARLNGSPVRFMVDSGCPTTHIDRTSGARLKLQRKDLPIAFQAHDSFWGWDESIKFEVVGLSLGGVKIDDLWASSFDATKASRTLHFYDEKPIDGILGNDILRMHGCILDFARRQLLIQCVADRLNFSLESDKPSYDHTEMCDRSFRLPITIPASLNQDVAEFRLFVSRDFGKGWQFCQVLEPSARTMHYSASEDGPLWFAVQLLKKSGDLSPKESTTLKPLAKVWVRSARAAVKIAPSYDELLKENDRLRKGRW